ncbi:ROK family glucokinase [Cellulomonas carbonis]|uniref:Glucokinase n=1 Tax=Cellulomonas carbonis T26 TaxID=947969 RepID=A0A0A0BS66_9CELL|nr:ROK family glucokinase [Cellulomonas carbonis]KGM10522.1 glucokinase [Cellulomonas carbonis T26]GGB93087.1 glucokinase [Cellulomonas carbonis]
MYAIGVDIGGTKIAAGVVDEEGTILARAKRRTEALDASEIDRAVADLYLELSAEHPVGALGVAAAGFISSDRRTALFAPNVAWRDYPLRDRVAELIGDPTLPVVVENDANAAGWAEFRFGAGRDVEDMLLLTVGTGLGGALVVDGRLVRGAWGVAAEVGHMRVVPEGHLCGCGLRGCWEQYASGSALVREARAVASTQPDRAARLLELAGGKAARVDGPSVTQAAREGDALAGALLADLGRWVGAGSASVAALLDPALVVLGGGVADAGPLLLEPAREAFLANLSGRGYRPEARLELASMGNDAGIVGAADLARI